MPEEESSDEAIQPVSRARDRTPPRTMEPHIGRGSFNASPLDLVRHPDLGSNLSGAQILSQASVVELLEQDDRPCFVVDLADSCDYDSGPLNTVFVNSALRICAKLPEILAGRDDHSPSKRTDDIFLDFKAWTLGPANMTESSDARSLTFLHCGIHWTRCSLKGRLRLIRGTEGSQSICPPERRSIPTSPRLIPTDSFVHSFSSDQPASFSGLSRRALSSSGTDINPDPTTIKLEDLEPSRMLIGRGLGVRRLSSEGPLYESNAKMLQESLPDLEANRLSEDLDNPFRMAKSGFFDWTRQPSSPDLPLHIQFVKSIDWGSTSLGPMEHWSAELRYMCNLLMTNPNPAAMYWGEDLVVIYNEAYIPLAGRKHPDLMGQVYTVGWAEIWVHVKDSFAAAKLTAQSTMKDDDCLFLGRNGYLEESYFSWSIIPLVGSDGSVVGLYNPAFENTRRKIAERRMLTLHEIGERTRSARDLKGFWRQVLIALEYNTFDIPFAILYSVDSELDSDASSINSSSGSSTRQCCLEGVLGVAANHPAAPQTMDLRSSPEGFCPEFREAMRQDCPIVLDLENGTLNPFLLEGIEFQGFGDPCRSAIVLSIHPTSGENGLAFLVLGVNPRRKYDDDYRLFIQLMTRQLATSMAAVVLFEEEIRQSQRAVKMAALDRIKLSEQLAARTEEAVWSERKFARMAEFAPVGIFIADSLGRITFCNDTWFDISHHPKTEKGADNWIESVKDDDKVAVEAMWRRVIVDLVSTTAEFRFKAPFTDDKGASVDTWVLFSAYPEMDEDHTLKGVFGSITDITQRKKGEDYQKRRMEEAVELKRQQENFIDITSHEMRNPLSAILQCADEIQGSLTDFYAKKDLSSLSVELLESNIDAAQTISLCAQHQKRIIDDVLTLSKLDSSLLLVTPTDIQPISVVQRALKMFQGEFQSADIQLKFVVGDTFKSLQIDWVRLDPSRLLQILINLISNAIKFTTMEPKRVVTVSIDACLEKPSGFKDSRVAYVPSRSKIKDVTQGPEWGNGEQLYLRFIVEDSGRGLNEDEKKLLFLRFSQASPRTHVQYGGSGLGLFISRELTELQGGEIGVASESGEGSTFAFYIKVRRSKAPIDAADLQAHMMMMHHRSPSNERRYSTTKTKRSKLMPSVDGESSKALDAHSSALDTDDGADADLLTVLIVEDNLVNQRVFQRQLRNVGWVVRVANHGEEALEQVKNSRLWIGRENERHLRDFGMILMDLEMPVMDGMSCARQIRRFEREGKIVKHVPIIAVTANTRTEQIQNAIGAGMDEVVSKPFRIPELIAKVEELVDRFRSANSSPSAVPDGDADATMSFSSPSYGSPP
ncbi:MAG: hypothetical protein M1819_000652 [Sarea resinae]|nr:MAG: hypothetical protein M1819_000652 [Sarea resinae]